MRSWIGALILGGLLAAGCASPAVSPDSAAPSSSTLPSTGGPPPSVSPSGSTTFALDVACPSSCYEPTAVVDSTGRVFVTVANAGGIAIRSTDGTWSYVDSPTLPDMASRALLARGDGTLFVDEKDRLWYLSLGVTGTGIGASVLLFVGIQVARSDDGGSSWAVNTFIGPFETPPELLAQAERPWLAFGDGIVYVAYPHWAGSASAAGFFQGVPDGLMVASSVSDGASFSAPVRAARATDRFAIPGRPVVQADGTLLVPYTGTDGNDPSSYLIARSTDRGATFTQILVTADGGFRFPALVEDSSGTLWAAWLVDGAIQFSSSPDGMTWTAPVRANEAESPPGPSPWLQPIPGGLLLSWSEGPDRAIVLGTLADGALTRHAGLVSNGTAYTDFVHFSLAPDGSVWIPSADASPARAYVTRWQRNLTAQAGSLVT